MRRYYIIMQSSFFSIKVLGGTIFHYRVESLQYFEISGRKQ